MRPLISIIVPVYNAEQYLVRCIESITSQTYENLEIILVNDGSTDSCGDICNEYAKADERIVVIHKENGGLVSARKAGIKLAKGEYIGFVDNDDWIEPDMYNHLLNAMLKYNVSLVATGCIMEYGDYSYKDFVGVRGVYSQNEIGKFNSLTNIYVTNPKSNMKLTSNMWDKLFKKEIVVTYYLSIPDNITFGEDLACTYACVPFIQSLYVSDEVFYHYNKANPNSITSNAEKKQIVDMLNTHEYIKNVYSKHQEKISLTEQINVFCFEVMMSLLSKCTERRLIEYRFPMSKLTNIKRLVIYGAGKVGHSYCLQFDDEPKIEIVGIVDKNKEGTLMNGRVIDNVDALYNLDFDAVVIAIKAEKLAQEIKMILKERYSIEESKLKWHRPVFFAEEMHSSKVEKGKEV